MSAALPFVIPSELRISYYAALTTTTYAAFFEESRMKFTETTKPDRKSGGSRGICGFTFGHSEAVVGESPPGFRFSINVNRRSLRFATLRSG